MVKVVSLCVCVSGHGLVVVTTMDLAVTPYVAGVVSMEEDGVYTGYVAGVVATEEDGM